MKERLRVAVCDDDKAMLEIMASAINTAFLLAGQAVETESFVNAKSMHERMKEEQFDVIFLDIDMPQVDGISFADFLRKSRNNVDIIFVSNREDKVFDSFKVRPYGFVRKSMFLNDITVVVESYIKDSAKDNAVLVIESGQKKFTIKINDIVYIENYGHAQYFNVLAKNDSFIKYETHSTISILYEKLESCGFIYANRSTLVNCHFIKSIDKDFLKVKPDVEISISRERRREVGEKYLAFVACQKNSRII